MPLELKQIYRKEYFAPLVVVEHEAYSTPRNSGWEIFKGPSVAECTERQWNWHLSDPKSNWINVVDTDAGGQVIGGAQWIINKTNPFETPAPALIATWWEEGSELRKLTETTLAKFSSGRAARMNRPHLLIGYCFVHPSHRRRGAGKLLMHWGCDLADKMELECFVESTDDGRALYESMGFVVVDHFFLDGRPVEEDGKELESEEWAGIRKEVFPEPMRVWVMWRPKGGRFVEGETKYSWEE